MAQSSYRPWFWSSIGALLLVCSLSISPRATITTNAGVYGVDHVTAVIVASYDSLAPFALFDAKVEHAAKPDIATNGFFSAPPVRERASRSAVRPTAIAGWRSGRTRTLAA